MYFLQNMCQIFLATKNTYVDEHRTNGTKFNQAYNNLLNYVTSERFISLSRGYMVESLSQITRYK